MKEITDVYGNSINVDKNAICVTLSEKIRLLSGLRVEVLRHKGLLIAGVYKYRGFEFGEWTNGQSFWSPKFRKYLYIKRNNSVLRCENYEVYINRIYNLFVTSFERGE